MASAFFYGILLHPKILKRVLKNDASHLQICPAILTGYTRHKVKARQLSRRDLSYSQQMKHVLSQFEDYPAIIPGERGKALLGRELTVEENSVRGTLVAGLTADDITFLDVFEGYMYDRLRVRVHPLGPFTPIPADTTATFEAVDDNLISTTALLPLATVSELAEPIEAQTYVWCLEDSDLEKGLWSFDEFVKTNAWKWIGEGARENGDYAEVDEARERMQRKTAPDDA